MHPIRAPRRSKGSKPFGTSSRPRPRSIWHGTSGACSRCAFRSLRRLVPTYAPFAEDELRDMLTRHAKLNECQSPIEMSLLLPVRDVTSELSNASCLSFVRELARSSAAELVGIARSHGSGSVCHPTLNMWLRWPCRRGAFFDRLMSKAF